MNYEEIKDTIDYIENNLLSYSLEAEPPRVAYASQGHLYKRFSLIMDTTVAENIRNRSLYESALDIIKGETT